MNKAGRQRLNAIYDDLQEAIEALSDIKEDEEEKYDNLPEGLKDSDRGADMQNAIEMLDEVIGHLEDAQSVIEQI